jgi:hypothetical protein
MGQQFPLALQLALYALSAAGIVLAAVLVHVLLRFKAQLDRIATAAENLESELTPLARETRIVVGRLGDLSDQAQEQLAAAGAIGGAFLAPARIVNRAVGLLRTGITAFLVSFWKGRQQTRSNGAFPS